MNLNQSKFIRVDTATIVVSLCTYLAYVILPMFSAVLPQILRYGVLALIFGFFIIGAVLLNKKSGAKTLLLLFVVTVFVILMYLGKWRYGGTDFMSYIINAYMFWMPLLYTPSVIALESETKRKIYLFTLFLFMITVFTTIIGSIVYTDSSRIMASGVTGESGEQVLQYSKLNIGGYGFVYGLVVLMPFLFYGARRLNHKVFYIISIALSILTVIFTQYSIALVTVVVLIAAVIVFTRKNTALSVTIAVIAVLGFFLMKDYIIEFLKMVMQIFYDNDFRFLSDRLGVLIELLNSSMLTGHALVRTNLYQMSFDAFLANPLVGSVFSPHSLGGHSEILDILGAIGIVGLAILVLILSEHVKNIRLHKGTNAYKYCIFSFVILLFIAMFNTVLTSSPIAVSLFLIPVVLPEEGVKAMIKLTVNSGRKI